MEELVNFKAESRDGVGKKVAKQIRREGKIPAIIYGDGKDPIPISIGLKDVKSVLKMEKKQNTILRILRDDIQVDAMLKELQYDYLSDNIIHADFIRLDLNKEIEVSVPITIIGESIGVRVEDGVFDFVTRDIRVKALPTLIPTNFEIDVTDLHSGNSIKVDNIEPEENVKIMTDRQVVICAVVVKGAAEEEEIEEEEEGEEGEETTDTADDTKAEAAESEDKDKK